MRYSGMARLLHWLTVAMLLAIGTLGLWLGWAAPEDEDFKLRLYALHESLGITLLPVTLLRLLWRAFHKPPPVSPPLPHLMALAAEATHAGLYGLLLLMPVLGLLATNAWGFPLTAWGLIPIPSPIGEDQALAPLLSQAHAWVALLLGLVVAMHVGAALWHHFGRGDDTLRRMLP